MKLNTLQQLIEMGIRVELNENGQPVVFSPKGNILKQHRKPNGYLYVHTYFKCKQESISVHRISYIWFKGDIPEGLQIDHINFIKTDNRPANLQVLTGRENCMRKVNYGAPKALIVTNVNTGEEEEFDSRTDAARKLNLDERNIYKVLNGKRSRVGNYTFRYKED